MIMPIFIEKINNKYLFVQSQLFRIAIYFIALLPFIFLYKKIISVVHIHYIIPSIVLCIIIAIANFQNKILIAFIFYLIFGLLIPIDNRYFLYGSSLFCLLIYMLIDVNKAKNERKNIDKLGFPLIILLVYGTKNILLYLMLIIVLFSMSYVKKEMPIIGAIGIVLNMIFGNVLLQISTVVNDIDELKNIIILNFPYYVIYIILIPMLIFLLGLIINKHKIIVGSFSFCLIINFLFLLGFLIINYVGHYGFSIYSTYVVLKATNYTCGGIFEWLRLCNDYFIKHMIFNFKLSDFLFTYIASFIVFLFIDWNNKKFAIINNPNIFEHILIVCNNFMEKVVKIIFIIAAMCIFSFVVYIACNGSDMLMKNQYSKKIVETLGLNIENKEKKYGANGLPIGAVKEGNALIEGVIIGNKGICVNEDMKEVVDRLQNRSTKPELHIQTIYYSSTLGKNVIIDANIKTGTRHFCELDGTAFFRCGEGFKYKSAEEELQTYEVMKGLAKAIDGSK